MAARGVLGPLPLQARLLPPRESDCACLAACHSEWSHGECGAMVRGAMVSGAMVRGEEPW